MDKRPKLYGAKDACEFLDVSYARFYELLKRYDIPHQKTSSGNIFFEEDLIAFRESRKDKMKYKGKNG